MEEKKTSTIITDHEKPYPSSTPSSKFLIKKLMINKRKTWVFFLVFLYTILISISWNILRSVLSWSESTTLTTSSNVMYVSVILGVAFGMLSMVAALAVAVPATLVTWITVVVLLSFSGKTRKALIVEGKELTSDITRFVVKVLIKEGNVVAVICAVIGYFVLVRSGADTVNNYEM